MTMYQATPLPLEKDQLHAQENPLDRELPPTPTSLSLGSPISPLMPGSGFPPISHPPTPPPDSSPASTSSRPDSPNAQHPQKNHHGLPPLNYSLYSPPLFDLSSDRTSIKSSAPYLSRSPDALISLVREQSTVPPKPQIHIVGKRGHRTDFALKLNLLPLLVPEGSSSSSPTGSPRMDHIRCVGPKEMALRGGTRPALVPDLDGLEAWARRYIDDTAPVKAFVLQRRVVNLDRAWLESRVRSLVASMGYRGAVAVTFPVTHARVVVQSPDRVSRLFTELTTLFAARRTYEVVKAVWPFASCMRGQEGAGPRICAVQSEEQWWYEWELPIRAAIAARRHGWVTNEDRLEALMEGKGKMARADWEDGGGFETWLRGDV